MSIGVCHGKGVFRVTVSEEEGYYCVDVETSSQVTVLVKVSKLRVNMTPVTARDSRALTGYLVCKVTGSSAVCTRSPPSPHFPFLFLRTHCVKPENYDRRNECRYLSL